MTNWTKVVVGGAVFLVGLGEPTPLVELYGLAIVANGLGVKVPVGF